MFKDAELSWKSVETLRYTSHGPGICFKYGECKRLQMQLFPFYAHNSDGFDDNFHLVLSEQ